MSELASSLKWDPLPFSETCTATYASALNDLVKCGKVAPRIRWVDAAAATLSRRICCKISEQTFCDTVVPHKT